MNSLRAAIIWLVGLVVGAVSLWLALRAIDLDAVLAIMSRTSKLDVLGIIGCTFGFVTVKALRWGCLVRHIQPMSLRQLIGPTLAGIAVNYGVPHSGEFVRTWMVAHRENLPKAALLASIAVERIFDFCAVLLLGLVALLAAREVIDTLRAYLWVSLAFIGVASGITMSFVFWAARALDISRRLLEPLPVSACSWILRNLEYGISGLRSLQQGPTLIKVLGLSVVQWALMAGCVWLSLHAIGIVPDPAMALVILLLLVIGLTLPAAPGQVGTTQIAFLLGATPFGLNKEAVMAGSFLYNVFVPLPLIIAGAGMLLAHRAAKNVVQHRFSTPPKIKCLSRPE